MNVLAPALVVACGARSPVEPLLVDEGGTSGRGGAPSSGGVSGVSGFGATGNIGATGGVITGGSDFGGTSTGGRGGTAGKGGTGTGGTGATGPDFDFTQEPNTAVAFMNDPAHNGAQMDADFDLPLVEKWRLPFDGGVSYPIIVGSRVFVAVKTPADEAPPGARVYAFDTMNGEMLWRSDVILDESSYRATHLAYDRGALFAVTGGGTVTKFEPSDGLIFWRVELAATTNGTTPVASGGALFFTAVPERGGPALFALDERDGSSVYQTAALGGTPTIGANTVFTSGGCHRAAAHWPVDGTVLWRYAGDDPCTLRGGFYTVYDHGVLFTGDPDSTIVTLDVNTGDYFTTLDANSPVWPASAFDGEVAVQSVIDEVFEGMDPTTGGARWMAVLPARPTLPALLTPSHTFLVLQYGAEGDRVLHAVDSRSHDIVWHSPEPVIPAGSDWHPTFSEPAQAMAAGGGILAVALDNALVVYAHEDAGFCGDRIVQSNETCDGEAPPGMTCTDCQLTLDDVMMAAGYHHTCGLRADGSVTCWGEGANGRDPPPGAYQYISAYEDWAAGVFTGGSPAFWGRWNQTFTVMGPFTKLEAGQDGYCGLFGSGALVCEGLSTPPTARAYDDLSVFLFDVCAIARGGDLICYRSGTTDIWDGEYRSVAVASNTICGLRTDRTLACKGAFEPPPGEFISISAGSGFMCGIRPGGRLDCFGTASDIEGLLDPPSGRFVLVEAGIQHACAITVEGRTLCWGDDQFGQATPPEDFP